MINIKLEETRKEIKKLLENFSITEESSENDSFIYTSTDGTPYSVKVEKEEDGGLEFYVNGKDGNLIDIFKPIIANKDGGIPSKIRTEIMNDYKMNHQNNETQETKLEEMNSDVVANIKKQYPDKSDAEIKSIYYATANKQKRNPETYKTK